LVGLRGGSDLGGCLVPCGVDRRDLFQLWVSGHHGAAGRSKSLADPFLPQKPEDIDRLRAIQTPIHQAFIAHVQARRGKRLADADLFNADIWVGQQAVDLGLADGIGHLVPKMKSLYGDKVRFAVHGQRRGLLSRFGLSLAEDALHVIEERAQRAQFGG